MINALVFVRIFTLFATGLLGAYIGDSVAYVIRYFMYVQVQHSDYFALNYIISAGQIVGIAFGMLVYSPGLAIAWWIRKPAFMHGKTASTLSFFYFFLVFFLNSFFAGGFVRLFLITIITSIICVVLFRFFQRQSRVNH